MNRLERGVLFVLILGGTVGGWLFLISLLAGCAPIPEDVAEHQDGLGYAHQHIGRHLGPGLHHVCPTDRPCRVMPMGDSITDGGTSGAVGYRPPLWGMMGGPSITFVGSLASGPDTVDGAAWPRNHEGHSGWSIDAVGSVMTGLQVIAADRIATYRPDVVLLMIGTNDIQLGLDDGAPARLERLVRTINAPVILSTILPTQDAAQNIRVDAFNAAIPGIVERLQADGRFVELVDQHAGFDQSWLADKLHPTDVGYGVLAGKWRDALSRNP